MAVGAAAAAGRGGAGRAAAALLLVLAAVLVPVVIVKVRAAEAAEAAKKKAEQKKMEADAAARKDRDDKRRSEYLGDMHAADLAWKGEDYDQVRRLLDHYRPIEEGDADVRGWEWYLLDCRQPRPPGHAARPGAESVQRH